ncbi:MAG: class I mannose-6-phosphate isomerase [Acidobacteria bacterium]|nr:class I mannose-6-phosphate isomerase [Acidobacteriota bacterium]
MTPVRLEPKFVERTWGAADLSPWFPAPPPRQKEPFGEVWMTSDACGTSEGLPLRELMDRDGTALLGHKVKPAFGGRFPILVKFLFTSGKLSLQVHPDDAYAEIHEKSPGKTEMWYVLRADPGATIAAGFTRQFEVAEVRAALADKSLETLVRWWPAQAGETYFTPAKTVHAVGAGLVICEIQQNSDVTYRLWDYDRPRPLHIEESMAVAELGPHPGPVDADGNRLVECPYFVTERHSIEGRFETASDPDRFHLLIVTEGAGAIGDHSLRAGDCWLVPAALGGYAVTGELTLLRVYLP